ncbi:MAG: hypothetical protein R3B70_42025 [Polyangiaceae bacterium]
MPAIVRARVSSEEDLGSAVQVPPGSYNTAVVFMEPATVARGIDQHQDTVRWRLSVEQTIELAPQLHGQAETYTASLATITLSPVHHARQAVALWYWPILGGGSSPGRVTGLAFRWESDSARASADVLILATFSLAAPFAGMCGLFALPYPGSTDVLEPFGSRGR